tara:strand:- start:203 stop:910 length:708 start_codon:yes stop_codon:yes gene_type:complete
MYNNKVINHKKFFKKINFEKLKKEIFLHEKKLNNNKLFFEGGAALNFIGEEYKELNKILRQLYESKKIFSHFKSEYIINGCSAISNKENYKRSSVWHRDVRYLNEKGRAEMILCIIPVTPCNKDNGSTLFKLKNKKIIQKELFPGDILIADARLLHRGGDNKKNKNRIIITIALTPPHIKPIMDYSEIYNKFKKKEKYLAQLLGYKSRTPKTLKEFFQSTKNRFFQKDQLKTSMK